MMNEAIGDMLSKRIKVTTIGASTRFVDNGVLETYDHPWLRLRKNNGQILCIPVYSIRLIELD